MRCILFLVKTKTIAIYKMRIVVVIVIYFFCHSLYAQLPNDCVNAITVCGNGVFSSNADGIGTTQEVTGCGGMEHNSIWLRINVVQSGNLGFHIRPNDTDLAVDYDFWVYGANRPCNNLGAPIRCATTNPIQAGLTSNHTGMYGSTTQTQVGPGANGNGYVRWLTVTAGETYYIAIDRPEGDGGFELEWIGSATNGTGAFSPPPTANSIPDYKTCSTNPNVGIFDFNSIRSSINPDLVNNTIAFFDSEANAVDNTNALPNIISNATNPQEIFVRVTDNITGCFSITSFNLQVYPVPDAEIIISDTSVCSGEDVTITLNGTPNSILEYNINGDTSQFVLLDDTGTYSFTDSPTSDTTYTLIDASIEDANNITVCSQAVNESVSVTVNEINAPTVTSNGSLCVGDDAEITFSGHAGAEINFLLNGVADVITLDASGNYMLTVVNVQVNVEVELLNMELPTAPFCTLDLTGTDFTVTVNPLPMYENLPPIELCDFNNPGDEEELFLLDIPEIIAGQNGVEYTIHELLVDAENDVNALEGDPNNPNLEISFTNASNPQILYIRAEDEVTGCFTIIPLELHVLPIPVVIQPSNLEECDTTENEGFAQFNLTDIETELLGSQNPANFSITYFLSQAEAETPGTPINSPEAYENSVIDGETIFVRVETNGDSDCFAITSFDIVVNSSPNTSFEMTATCDDATATILGDTGGAFSFYQTPTDVAVINPTDGEITNVTQGETYVIAYTINGTDCSAFETFSVTIPSLPNVMTPSNLQVCGVVSDGAWFDLDSKISEITNNDATLSVSFYLTQILAETGNPSDALPSPYFGTSANQTIYVRVVGNGGCVVYTELVLELLSGPQLVQPSDIEICDDASNDGIATFDVTSVESEMLNSQNPDDFLITYHYLFDEAQNGTNAITNPEDYQNINSPYEQVIYIRVQRLDSPDCISTTQVRLVVNVLMNPQVFSVDGSTTICVDFDTDELQSGVTLTTNLQGANYTYQWFLNGDEIAGATLSSYEITTASPGFYSVYVVDTNSDTECGEEAFSNDFEVIQSGLASLVSVTTSQPFSNNQSITVSVQGYGDYWFQLNDGPISDNNGVFNNVASGVHTVTVYDRKTDNPSCGFIIIEDIQIIDYPKFFTPNNDGDNDTWNITAMQDQPNSSILIYDRYGKILTYIKPYGPGWDGTYNGQRMMSNDYWFVLTYQDYKGTLREFRAHFALKR